MLFRWYAMYLLYVYEQDEKEREIEKSVTQMFSVKQTGAFMTEEDTGVQQDVHSNSGIKKM